MSIRDWNSAEVPLIIMEASQSLMNDGFFGWQKVFIPPRYYECVAWIGGLPSLPQARRVLAPKKSSQSRRLPCSVHHFSISAEPARASRSILANAV
jgi:hypothetical protein